MSARGSEDIAKLAGVEPLLVERHAFLKTDEVAPFVALLASTEHTLDRLLFAGEAKLTLEFDGNTHVVERAVRDLSVRRHACGGLEFATAWEDGFSVRFCPAKDEASGRRDVAFLEFPCENGSSRRLLRAAGDRASVEVAVRGDVEVVGVWCVEEAEAETLREEEMFRSVCEEHGLRLNVSEAPPAPGGAVSRFFEFHDPRTNLVFAVCRCGTKYEMSIPVDFERGEGDLSLPYAQIEATRIAKYIQDAVEVARVTKKIKDTRRVVIRKRGAPSE